jgi:hypothetical protein
MLMTIHKLPMAEQLQKLEENMKEWMGGVNDQASKSLIFLISNSAEKGLAM